MPSNTELKKSIKRMRQKPSIFDYCYFTTKASLKAFCIFKNLIYKTSEVLDVGCGTKVFEELLNDKLYQGLDFNPVDDTVTYHDLSLRLPFNDDSKKAIILSEVLEHVPDPFFLLDEIDRVANRECVIFISTPFAMPVHGSPFDYFRFTHFFYQKISKKYGWKINMMSSSNGFLSTPVLIFSQFSLVLPVPTFALQPFWFIMNILAIILDAAIKFLPNNLREKASFGYPMGINVVFIKK